MAEQRRKRLSPSDTVIRRQRLLEMRRVKTPWQTIADELDYASIGAACTDYKRVMEELRTELDLTRDEIVREELEHLEMLTRTTLEVMSRRHVHVSGGKVARDTIVDPETGEERPGEPLLDDGPTIQAVETLRRLSERRAKLLGIDAPTRIEADGELKVIVEGVNTEEMK